MKKLLTLAIVLLALLIAVPVSAGRPATLMVDDDGADCPDAMYSTIQDAVDAASDGDTIYVCAGTYSESVRVVGFTSLAIKAQGAGHADKSVVVNPTPSGFTNSFYVMSDGVTIEGFEIADTNFGIWFEGSHNKFSNNYIHGMDHSVSWDDGGIGICLWDMNGGSDYNVITNNVIEDIERTGVLLDVAWTGGGAGINTGNSIVNNEISGTPWGAIEALNAEDTTINGNIISDCGDWGVALLNAQAGIASNDNTIANNEIQDCSGGYGIGIWVYAWAGSADQNSIHHNDIQNITGSRGLGIWLRQIWTGSVDYNTIHHNSVGTPPPSAYQDDGTGNKDFKNSWN